MMTFKPTFSILSLLILILFFSSCNGQPSSNATFKKEQHPKIVQTQGAQGGVIVGQLLDNKGNLWFSIDGEGIYRYDGKSFTNFNTKDGLCNNFVVDIIQDKSGNILLGTQKGICKYDGKKFTTFPFTDNLSITCMLEEKNGNLWFGAMGKGIYRYDGKRLDNFLNNHDLPFNLGNKNQLILDILQDKKGQLWFSSWNGGGVWRYDGKDFKNFLPSEAYYQSNQDNRKTKKLQLTIGISLNTSYSPSPYHIADDMIYSMTEDHVGNIWFATRDHGLCYYNGETFKTIGRHEGFTSRGASAILQDDKHNFWITTFDSGIWSYDGKTFKNFTEDNGLVNDAVMNVLKDKKGHLWFGTKFFGLSRYNGKTFTTFSQRN